MAIDECILLLMKLCFIVRKKKQSYYCRVKGYPPDLIKILKVEDQDIDYDP
jgi:hypothetical protein